MTDETKEMAKIISIKDGKRRQRVDPPMTTGRSTKPECKTRHKLVIVDVLARTLECKECGVSIDPIGYLAGIAREADWLIYMRRESADLRAEVERLKDERSKLRSSLRESKKRAERRGA